MASRRSRASLLGLSSLLFLLCLSFIQYFYARTSPSPYQLQKREAVGELVTYDQAFSGDSVPTRVLDPRAVGITWERALQTGTGLLCGLAADAGAAHAPQSQYTNVEALGANGWTNQGDPDEPDPSDVGVIIGASLNGLGLSHQFPPHREVDLEQNSRGETFDISFGYYHNVYNTKDGVIIATDNRSPKQMNDPNSAIRYTPLQLWSDVVYLAWLQQCQADKTAVSNLNYVYRFIIINEDTKYIINEALRRSRNTLTEWPGTTFHMSTDEGKAILGTPNGRGVAWLLINHKGSNQFGKKTIWQVTVFNAMADNALEYFMVFKIV